MRLFCEKPPKGFEKYYKNPKSKESSTKKEASKNQNNEKAKTDPPKPSTSASSSGGKPQNDWNFGMFSPTQSRNKTTTGGGRPIGGNEGNDRDKLMLFGAIGAVALVAALTYFEMGYKEIGWKEFVNK